MRSGPGTRFEIPWNLARGYPLQVLARSQGWIKVRDFENDVGWVLARLTSRKPHLVVKTEVLNLRRGPGTGHRAPHRRPGGLRRGAAHARAQGHLGARGAPARRPRRLGRTAAGDVALVVEDRAVTVLLVDVAANADHGRALGLGDDGMSELGPAGFLQPTADEVLVEAQPPGLALLVHAPVAAAGRPGIRP